MAQERSIEVKVGALILVSAAILAGLILIMGGLSFERSYTVFVEFENPGGLQTGAPVRMAGVKVGKVQELQFLGGKSDSKTNKRALIRAKISIEQRVKDAIHEDADFYVTTQGVLGEQFMAVEPGTPGKKIIEDGAVVRGIDPPRLDLFLAKGYELLDTTMNAVRNNRELISDIATNTAGLLRNLNGVLSDNRERVNRIVANAEQVSAELAVLSKDANKNYVNNPKILHTIDNVDRLSTDLQRDSGPLLKDAREAIANLNRASSLIGSPEEKEKLKKALGELEQVATRANTISQDAQTIVTHIKKGKGTVGGLVMDEAIYDDVQEMVRDLKHNPWKFLWRE
jgi:phospholipid/cholesterol/gamma-HCH transport system substrate-binding protein